MIAAGEVVERPAAALKELLENSIDSEATQIEVDFSEDILSRMRVRDDGCGIDRQELALATQPHTTSKLHEAGELENMATLGFRGEALASIAALGDMTLRSRTADATEGAELVLHGNWQGEKSKPCVMAPGTEVIVHDLFKHAPARRKFMHKPQTEWAHCDTVLRGIAIANPGITFSMSRSGKRRHLYPAQTERERVRAVLGDRFADNATSFDVNAEPMSIRGYINLDGHGNQTRQFLTLNGRTVKDRHLRQAIRKACEDMIREAGFPYAIYLTLPRRLVDVNAHPAKLEVRFREQKAMFRFAYDAVANALRKPIGSNESIPAEHLRLSQQIARAGAASRGKGGKKKKRTPPTTSDLPFQGPRKKTRPGATTPDPDATPTPNVPAGLGHALTLLHGVYLLAESDLGLVVIDIHAAHERVIYEEMKEKGDKTPVPAQCLLDVIELDLSPLAIDTLQHCRQTLHDSGFIIVNNDGVEYLHSVPKVLGGNKLADPAKLVLACLDELAEMGMAFSATEAKNKVLATMACHAAVRGFQDHQSLDDLNKLLRRMESTLGSGKCNHGRPTWRILKIQELDRLFGRGE